MSEKHTPGRLVAEELDQDADYAFVIRQIDGDPYPLPVADCNRQADARRLVACWNACEGMPIEEIEELATICGVQALIVHVDNQRVAREELLTELQTMTDAYAKAMKDAGVSHYPEALAIVRLARAAIAKVKGGAA